MVSVKRFIHDEPALFKVSKAFVAQFFRCADPIVYVACKLPDANAQIAWTLLGSALFQDRTYPDILRLLAKLYERFPGDKLWTLPVPKAGEIEEVVEQTFGSRNWSVFEHVAGIFWSVGLFVRHHPDLVAWALFLSSKAALSSNLRCKVHAMKATMKSVRNTTRELNTSTLATAASLPITV